MTKTVCINGRYMQTKEVYLLQGKLKLLIAALFVNVAISLALLADLEEGGDGEDEDGVDA